MPCLRRVVHLWRAGARGARRNALAVDAVFPLSGPGLALCRPCGCLLRRGRRSVLSAAASKTNPTPHDADECRRFAWLCFRRAGPLFARARSARSFGFGFVSQVTVDEASAAAAAGGQILGLCLG